MSTPSGRARAALEALWAVYRKHRHDLTPEAREALKTAMVRQAREATLLEREERAEERAVQDLLEWEEEQGEDM